MADGIVLILAGLFSGFLSGLLGVGGGAFFVPVLVFIIGASPHIAIGTSLAVIVPTALAGCLKHYRSGNVDLAMALMLSIGALGGAYLGASTAAQFSGALLRKVFGVFVIIVGAHMLFATPNGEAKPKAAVDAQQLY